MRAFVRTPIAAAMLAVLAAPAPAQDIQVELGPFREPPPPEIAGVPFPTPEPGYTQPVSRSCTILQGNGGSYSHTTPFGRHAWDYALPLGAPARAARDGVVVVVRQGSNLGGGDPALFANKGNQVMVDHLDGSATVYLHLQRERDPVVRVGEWVVRGETIGFVGDTGRTSTPHLHYAVVDPATWHTQPSRFLDFEDGEGVPRKGNGVPAGTEPAVPQETLAAYKRTVRAALAARAAGYPGLAWSFATGLPEKQRVPGFFYERVRAALEADAHAAVGQLRADPGDAAERLAAALGEARADRAVEAWVEGLRAECTDGPRAALEWYARALRVRDDERFLASARDALDRCRADLDLRIARSLHEASLAHAWYRTRVQDDAKEWQAEARELSRLHVRLLPAGKDDARRWYDDARDRCTAIRRTLQQR